MSNVTNTMFSKTQKLIRSNEENTNTTLDEKIYNCCYANTSTQGEKIIIFDGKENSIAQFCLEANVSGNANICVILNNVKVCEENVNQYYSTLINCYLKENNVLKITFVSESDVDIKINLKLKGCIESLEKTLSKLNFCGENINFIKNGLLSKSDNILAITSNIYNTSKYASDKYYDCNVNFKIGENDKISNATLYYDNVYILKDGENSKTFNIDNVDSMCLLTSNDSNHYYNVLYVINGELYLKSFNSNMVEVLTKKLGLNYISVDKVKSICSYTPTNYFWIKSKSGIWYLACLNPEGYVLSTREYSKCEDIANYYADNGNYLIQLFEEGVRVEKFNSLTLSYRMSFCDYLNVGDAFIYDDILYLVSGFSIEQIKL